MHFKQPSACVNIKFKCPLSVFIESSSNVNAGFEQPTLAMEFLRNLLSIWVKNSEKPAPLIIEKGNIRRV